MYGNEVSRRRGRVDGTTAVMDEDEGLPVLLTTGDVAKALKVAPSTLCRWRARGVGPRVYWLADASPRYLKSDVLAWLDRVSG